MNTICYNLAEIELIFSCTSEVLASDVLDTSSFLRRIADTFNADFTAIALFNRIGTDKVDLVFHVGCKGRNFAASLIQRSIRLIRERAIDGVQAWENANQNILVSCKQDASGQTSALILHRNDRSFDRKSAVSLELVHTAVRHRLPTSVSLTIPKQPMSKRLSQVLEGLLEGLTEKQIASSLQISCNTVHVYVKNLYRQHQVHSRAELLCKLLRPDGSIGKERTTNRLANNLDEIPTRDFDQTFQNVSPIDPISSVTRSLTDMLTSRVQASVECTDAPSDHEDVLLAVKSCHRGTVS